ncbi:class II aldolase/adducin family protein [Spirochaeta thermophila DSM 6578]|uniref:L-ribulose-5-phosphate 4-epimerase n=1 Tax=Winmispira thermophila (strain ATCC 700085 / DSM 6578 / Z-1203) TaxID=869211 RepID=G0GF06_WINT7|nr:L-ribulose-5-phosphate 4-epimerase AraD [Spirochaeta thermophila]AEJ62350.1 class II aldolase/adducin family protein [Spirochaeta thermophila DSM 6578]
MNTYEELRREVWKANLLLSEHRLALFTWGNVSGYDPDAGVVAIKPSGVPYDALTPEDIVVVSLEGEKVWGSLKPSSDTPTHLVLYREFPGLRGVTHTHAPFSVSWAQAGVDVPLYGTTHADHCVGPVPCTPYLSEGEVQEAYEEETGRLIVRTFKARGVQPLHTPMVLVAGHGPFTWGSSPEESVRHAVILEEICKMALWTRMTNPEVSSLPSYIARKHWERKHGPHAYYGQGS